jgi:16S rRNA U1498 N3-methylase RsmE
VALGPHVLRIGTAAALAAGLTRALLGDGPA